MNIELMRATTYSKLALRVISCCREQDPICLDFRKKVERDCWEAAGKIRLFQQRMVDFVEGQSPKIFQNIPTNLGLLQ
jgi:hypothetical protein